MKSNQYSKLVVRAVLTFIIGAATGCADKARPAFDRCVELEKTADDLDSTFNALFACQKAVAADPNSDAGRAASQKASELKLKYDRLEEERDAKVADFVAAANKYGSSSGPERALKAAEQVVQAQLRGVDAHCQGQRKPPKLYTFSGGSYFENELVAKSRGCERRTTSDTIDTTEYCCP